MLTHEYTYEACLAGSFSHEWTVDDCFAGRDFDFSKPFLPDLMAGTSSISCLRRDETRSLNQIRANSYCHIVGFIEESIIPMVIDHARAGVHDADTRLWSLLRFAEEEVKHQAMMRRARDQFCAGFGVGCGLVTGATELAEAVLATPPLTPLLLTSMVEWFTQRHYVEHVRNRSDLDPLFRDILRYHWIDESRHARMDLLLIDEEAVAMSPPQREAAIDALLEICAAIDGLLATQAELDLDALARAAARRFSTAEIEEITRFQRRSYRWTFLVSGLEHPNFVQMLEELSPTGAAEVARAARVWAA